MERDVEERERKEHSWKKGQGKSNRTHLLSEEGVRRGNGGSERRKWY